MEGFIFGILRYPGALSPLLENFRRALSFLPTQLTAPGSPRMVARWFGGEVTGYHPTSFFCGYAFDRSPFITIWWVNQKSFSRLQVLKTHTLKLSTYPNLIFWPARTAECVLQCRAQQFELTTKGLAKTEIQNHSRDVSN